MKPIVNKLSDTCAVILIPHLGHRVHVCTDQKEAAEATNCGNGEEYIAAGTYYNVVNGCKVYLWLGSGSHGNIAHECLHAVNIIHDHVGFRPDRENDEMDAYLLGYLVSGVYSALRLLNK